MYNDLVLFSLFLHLFNPPLLSHTLFLFLTIAKPRDNKINSCVYKYVYHHILFKCAVDYHFSTITAVLLYSFFYGHFPSTLRFTPLFPAKREELLVTYFLFLSLSRSVMSCTSADTRLSKEIKREITRTRNTRFLNFPA